MTRVDPRWWLAALGLGLVVFWVSLGYVVLSLVGDADPTELGSSSTPVSSNGWPFVSRCSVVMPEDLDR